MRILLVITSLVILAGAVWAAYEAVTITPVMWIVSAFLVLVASLVFFNKDKWS
jgi:hypothetical protein